MLTYQDILKNELLRRKRKNLSYSVSSFARDLKVSQPFLSQILSKKRKLSDDRALSLLENLKITPARQKLFINLVRMDLLRDPKSQNVLAREVNSLLKKHPGFSALSEDAFNVISDWYYFAILELTELKAFRVCPKWIGKRLGLNEKLIEGALERLKRLNLLEEDNKGNLKKTKKDYIFENVSSVAIKKHHVQSLALAQKALEQQPMADREFFTVTIPMNKKKMAYVKQAIRDFSEKLMSELQEDEPDSVNKLAIQFFRLDRETQ